MRVHWQLVQQLHTLTVGIEFEEFALNSYIDNISFNVAMKLARTGQTTTMEVLNYMITNHIIFVLGIHGKNRSFNVSEYLQNQPVNPHRYSRDVSFMDILPPEVMCAGNQIL